MKYLCYILHHLAFVVFTEIGCIKPVCSGMPLVYRYKASAFPFSCMHWQRVLFRKAKHDGAMVLNLRDTIAVLQRSIYSFWRISSLAFTNIFECAEIGNVSFDNYEPFSSGGWFLPATRFTSIYRITALHILHFIPRAKDLLTYCFLYTISSFVFGRFAA